MRTISSASSFSSRFYADDLVNSDGVFMRDLSEDEINSSSVSLFFIASSRELDRTLIGSFNESHLHNLLQKQAVYVSWQHLPST